MSRVTPARTCEELTRQYPDGTLASTGVGLEIAAGTSPALAMPLALLEIAAVALFAGRRDVVLAA